MTSGSLRLDPERLASHARATGHEGHEGSRGVHTVAPSSMSAWFQSPGGAGTSATRRSAMAHTRALPGPDFTSSRIAKSRARTRATLPSTRASRFPKAMLATAPAV